MNKNIFFSFSFLLILTWPVFSQTDGKKWTLEECVQYAIDHNIQIKQRALTTEMNQNTLKQAKLSRIPTLNAGSNYSFSSGRVLDETTYRFSNNSINYLGFNVGGSMNLFSGLQKVNTIKQNKYQLMASLEDLDRARNDISLSVALAYLQILLDKELLEVARQQLKVTKEQIQRTRNLVDAGSVPLGNLLEVEAQAASEEASVVNTVNALDMAYLNLTQMLELDSLNGFDIVVPEITSPDSLFTLPPISVVFSDAMNFMPEIRSATYQLKSSEVSLKLARGAKSPRLSLNGSFNTSFSDNRKKILGVDPVEGIEYGPYPFGEQMADNRNWMIGLGLTIPIFNGWQIQKEVNNARLGIKNAQLQFENERKTLYKEIQQAWLDARAAMNKYMAMKKTVASMKESFRYTSEKFNVGLVTSMDYNTAKTQLTKAQSDLLSAKYEFVFKINVLNFYRGKPFVQNIKF